MWQLYWKVLFVCLPNNLTFFFFGCSSVTLCYATDVCAHMYACVRTTPVLRAFVYRRTPRLTGLFVKFVRLWTRGWGMMVLGGGGGGLNS